MPKAWITNEITVLNNSYSGATGGADTGFQFSLQSIDRTTNAGWFKLKCGKEKKMKAALKVGGPETLNIYSAPTSATRCSGGPTSRRTPPPTASSTVS